MEEGQPGGEVRLIPVIGVRWCPKDGLIEMQLREGLSGPVHIGPFVRGEVDREFAPRGQRVWRTCKPGESTEMMDRPVSPTVFWRRVAFVRWDQNREEIAPLQDLGFGYSVHPESVERLKGTVVPSDIESDLKRQDDLLRRPRADQ